MNSDPRQPLPVRIVCATRVDRDAFLVDTLLGRSLRALTAGSGRVLAIAQRIELSVAANNRDGLPKVYNRAIMAARERPAILVFVHDDVMLCDYHWAERLRTALTSFDIVGLAGNRRRVPGQTGWAFPDASRRMDAREHLSGVVGHGTSYPPPNVSVYGPTGVEVKLLDGVMLAADSRRLAQAGVGFDERFDFHFYDLDLCRSAERAGLRMGTVALSVVHASGGNFSSDAWRDGLARYREKWGD